MRLPSRRLFTEKSRSLFAMRYGFSRADVREKGGQSTLPSRLFPNDSLTAIDFPYSTALSMTNVFSSSTNPQNSPLLPAVSDAAADAHVHPAPAVRSVSPHAMGSAVLQRLVALPRRPSVSPPSDSAPQTSPTALAQQLGAMWPRDAAAESSGYADDAKSESSDEFSVRVETEPAGQRAHRKRKLEEYVVSAVDRSDVVNLVAHADAFKRRAINEYPIMLADRLGDTRAQSGQTEPQDVPLPIVVETLYRCDDAQLAWDVTADHFHAAAAASRKLALPPQSFLTLDAVGTQCDEHRARFAIKTELLRAIYRFKASEAKILTGHVPALEQLLEPLRSALAHCTTDRFRELPLTQAPITGFDSELEKLFLQVRTLGQRVQQGDPVVTIPRGIRANQRDQWRARRASCIAEITAIAGNLWLALRGGPAPEAPVLMDAPWQQIDDLGGRHGGAPAHPASLSVPPPHRPDEPWLARGRGRGEPFRSQAAFTGRATVPHASRREPARAPIPIEEQWPALGQEPGQGTRGPVARAGDPSPQHPSLSEPTPSATPKGEQWPALGQGRGQPTRTQGAWTGGSLAVRAAADRPAQPAAAPQRPSSSAVRGKSPWGQGVIAGGQPTEHAAPPVSMEAHRTSSRTGAETGAGSSTSHTRNERAGHRRSFHGEDARSNAEVIAEYKVGRRSVDGVLAVTTSLLRAPGDINRSIQMLRAVTAAGIRPNVVIYNAAITACGDAGRADQALMLLAEMKALALQDPEMEPTLITYSSVISACAKEGRADEALRLFEELKGLAKHDRTMRPDVILYGAVIAACGKAGRAMEALSTLTELHELARNDRRMSPDVRIYNSAIMACANAGQTNRALGLLADLKNLASENPELRPDVRTYTAVITACAKSGRADTALALLAEIKALARQDSSMRPDAFVYTAVITACDRGGRVDKARNLRQELDSLRDRDSAMRRTQQRRQ